MVSTRIVLALVVIGAALSGCADDRSYKNAFSDKHGIPDSSHRFAAPPEQILQAVKFTLVQEGFIIEELDPVGGLVKAARDLADEKNSKLSYNVRTTVVVSPEPSGQAAVVTMAANQQTVTHDSSHNWIPLLGPIIVPLPGKKYSTTVTGEGTITDRGFYSDFYVAVERNLQAQRQAAAPASGAVAAAAPVIAPATAPSAGAATAYAAGPEPPTSVAIAASDEAAAVQSVTRAEPPAPAPTATR